MTEFKQDDIVSTRCAMESHDGSTTIGKGSIGQVTVVGIELSDGSVNGIEVLFDKGIYGHYNTTQLTPAVAKIPGTTFEEAAAGMNRLAELLREGPKDLPIQVGDYVTIKDENHELFPMWGHVEKIHEEGRAAPYRVKRNGDGRMMDFEAAELEVVTRRPEHPFDAGVLVTKQNFAQVAQWANQARITSPWTNPVLHVKTGFSKNPDFTVSVNIGDKLERTVDGKIQVWVKPLTPEDRPSELKKFRTDDPMLMAREMVHGLFYKDIGLPMADVYVVWFCSTLQNWKALVSTNVLDNAYYEVTYDGEKNRTYVDRYVKEINVTVDNTTGTADFRQITDFGRIW